ncbi:nucleotide exchange factor GrpE [Luteimonas sp. MC1895]|uniref:nucleotide exchange factor GrpE n=1 Tax=Luteimonas sp. MC1895 TaxID=2819513 RepID=UPI0018F0C1EA|nr:nucleotide exchange factor GrpE [Luteimonas sp. MC1895]MBJ6977805.1 nucleotide exchange factor GrpE [Luteimonas sp. MC1895]
MTTEQTPDHAAEAPADDLPLEDVIETLRAELEQVRAQSLVDRADLENQRRRMERDVQNACRFANKQLLGDLLPVFDSLDAALVAAGGSGPLHDGVELTLRELRRVTGNQGLVQIAPAAGDAFNPELHQAMSVVEAAGVEAGAVAQLFQKGYRLNEQLLRPAMVAVASSD